MNLKLTKNTILTFINISISSVALQGMEDGAKSELDDLKSVIGKWSAEAETNPEIKRALQKAAQQFDINMEECRSSVKTPAPLGPDQEEAKQDLIELGLSDPSDDQSMEMVRQRVQNMAEGGNFAITIESVNEGLRQRALGYPSKLDLIRESLRQMRMTPPILQPSLAQIELGLDLFADEGIFPSTKEIEELLPRYYACKHLIETLKIADPSEEDIGCTAYLQDLRISHPTFIEIKDVAYLKSIGLAEPTIRVLGLGYVNAMATLRGLGNLKPSREEIVDAVLSTMPSLDTVTETKMRQTLLSDFYDKKS